MENSLEQETIKQIAEKIEAAAVFIPMEWMEDISSGRPLAYTKGIMAGREQAVKILKEYKKS